MRRSPLSADGPRETLHRNRQSAIANRQWKCRRWESNPHGALTPRDFESRASASFTTPARGGRPCHCIAPCENARCVACWVSIRRLFVALRHRNFRLLWIGLLISFSGSLMQSAAILWHVSLLVPDNRRALALGLVGLVRVVPVVFFSLLSGVAADVYDRRKLMLFTQTAATALASVLAILTWRGLDAVWPVYAIAAASSAVGAFDLPARQALIPNLVPREHLANALTLNTIMFQVAAVAGPALGGIVIAQMGVGWAYAFNAVSFVVVIVALLMMRDVRDARRESRGGE